MSSSVSYKMSGEPRDPSRHRILVVPPLRVWPTRLKLMAPGDGNSSDSEENAVDTARIDDFAYENAVLKGANFHGFKNYSDLSHADIVEILRRRYFSCNEALAILMNAGLYLKHQEFHKDGEEFLLGYDLFMQSEVWKKANIGVRKHKFLGRKLLRDQGDGKGSKHFTLITSNPEDENRYHLVQSKPNAEVGVFGEERNKGRSPVGTRSKKRRRDVRTGDGENPT